MQIKNQFLNFITEKHYDLFHKRVLYFVRKNYEDLILNRLRDIKSIYDIEVSDLDFKFVHLDSKEGNEVQFDIVVIASCEYGTVAYKYNDHDYDSSYIWLTLECKGTLNDSFNFIKVEVSEYNKNKKTKPMSGCLVPIIRKEEYSKYADEIIKKYSDISDNDNKAPNIYNIAKNMGLSILEVPLCDSCSYGQLHFETSEVDIKDASGNTIKTKVNKNTILINTSVISLDSLASKNITIAHECVHYYLHRKTYLFAKMLEKDINKFECYNDGSISFLDKDENYKFLEIQANGIAPLIVSPSNNLNARIVELLKVYSLLYKNTREYMHLIIEDISREYDISIYAAKKRMIDLQVKDVFGSLEWVDGKYLRSYKTANIHNINDIFSISRSDFLQLMDSDKTFLYLFSKYDLLFVENKVCINDSKYVKYHNGNMLLTDYALDNLDECCLRFSIVRKNNNYALINPSFAYLCRDTTIDLNYDLKYTHKSDCITNDEAKNYISKNSKHKSAILKGIAALNVCESIKFIADYLKIDANELSINSKLSRRTIDRCFKNDPQGINKNSLIRICFALKVHPDISFTLIQKGGFVLVPSNESDDAIQTALISFRGHSLDSISTFIKNQSGESLI